MAELSLSVGVIGTVITVLMFLSPADLPANNRAPIYGEFESLPYICTLLHCSLWTYYGSMKAGEYIVAAVNGFGAVVETAYVIVYAPTKKRAKTGILVGILNVGLLGLAITTSQVWLKGEDRISTVGIMGAALNILMYGSPLSAMKAVVRTKSVEYMPFWLSLSVFLSGGVWLLYAILVGDVILAVPNGSGFLLGAMQLSVYAIYRHPKSPNTLFNQEASQQHHSLLS